LENFVTDNGSSTSGNGILMPNVVNFVISNVTASNNYVGIDYQRSISGATYGGIIDHVVATSNFHAGIELNATGATSDDVMHLTISNSIISNNDNFGVEIDGGSSGHMEVSLEYLTVNNNGLTGILADATCIVLLGRSVITQNLNRIDNFTTGNNFYSYKVNHIDFNTLSNVTSNPLSDAVAPQ
jgi:hypothetical protein